MGRTIDRILGEIDLLEYMRDCGYTPYSVGSCYSLKEHGSVRIYPESNTYFHPGTGDNRRMNVINFAAWHHNIPQSEAIKMLARELNDEPRYVTKRKPAEIKPEVKKELVLPEKSSKQYRHVYAYLGQKRCIDRSIVSDMIHRRYLYEDMRGNATFVGYDKDGKASLCFQRGCTDTPYKHIVSGSDFTYGWSVDNGASKLFVNEAIIDSMSVMSMFKFHGMDPNNYNYVATCGPSMKPIINAVAGNENIKTVYLGFDNDEAGRKYTQRAKGVLNEIGYKGKIIDKPPKSKDFNEDLQRLSEHKGKMEELKQIQTQNFQIERNIQR